MRRRDFIAGLGAAVWPLAARAQQPDKVRRIGVLMGFSEQDSEARRWVAAFEQKLAELGWKGGIDLRIEYRWPGGPPDRCSTAAECHGREADQGVACRPGSGAAGFDSSSSQYLLGIILAWRRRQGSVAAAVTCKETPLAWHLGGTFF